MKSTKLLVIGAVIVTFIVGLGITSNTDLFKGSLTGLNLNVKKNTNKAKQEYSYYIIESTKGVNVELAKFNGNKFVEDMNKAVKIVDRNFGAKIGSLPNTKDAIAAGDAFTTRPGMAGVGTGSRDGLINTGISDDRNSVASLGRNTTGMRAGGFDDLLPDFNGGMITISGNFGVGGGRTRFENISVGFELINSNPDNGRMSTVAGISNQDLNQLSNTFQNMFRDQPGNVGETNTPVDTEVKPVAVADNSGNDSQATTKTEPTTAKKEPDTSSGGSQPAKNDGSSQVGSQPAKNDGSSQVGQDAKKPSKKDPEKGSMDDPNSDRGYGKPTEAQLGALSKTGALTGPSSQRTKVDPATEAALRRPNRGAATGNPGEGSSGAQGNAVINGAFVLNIDCARSGGLCGKSNADFIKIIAIPDPNGGGLVGNPS